MIALVILLAVAGLLFTFSLGTTGYVIGGGCIVAAIALFVVDRRRRARLLADAPGDSTAIDRLALLRRPGWQRFLIGCGIFGASLSTLVAFVMMATAALPTTADAFFLALKTGDIAGAKTYLHPDARASTTDAELAAFAKNSALAEYESASWNSRGVENGRGHLEGTLRTRSGKEVPMRVEFRKDGEWKIQALRTPRDEGSDDAAVEPGESDRVRLVKATTAMFVDAVMRRDFIDFHRRSSGLWQRQMTVAKLTETFKSFSETGANFNVLLDMQPTLDSASTSLTGAYVIEGTYPTKPSQFTYRYSYVYEGLDWKLIGVSANVH
jgi:hypothetical protein